MHHPSPKTAADPTALAFHAPRRPLSAETVRLYAADWAAFSAWCGAQCVPTVPAAPHTIARYLAAAAATLGPGALTRRLAAIAAQHRQHGHASPTAAPAVKATMQHLRHSTSRRRGPPPSADTLGRMAASCPGDLAGLRDRALLLLAAAGLGRAGLVAVTLEQLRRGPMDLTLTVPSTDRAGRSQRTLTIPHAASASTCAVCALDAWLRVSDTRFGPVFRKIDRWGNIEHQALGADAVRRILVRRAVPRPRSRKPQA